MLNADGTLTVLEAGTPRGASQKYVPGDLLRVAVESGKVRYYRNGTLLYDKPLSARDVLAGGHVSTSWVPP